MIRPQPKDGIQGVIAKREPGGKWGLFRLGLRFKNEKCAITGIVVLSYPIPLDGTKVIWYPDFGIIEIKRKTMRFRPEIHSQRHAYPHPAG